MQPTEQSPEQPTPARPQPNRIVDAPATVQACAEDFSSGASVRAQMAKQQILRRTLTAVVLAAAAVFALSACSSTPPAAKPAPSPAASPAPRPAAAVPPTVDTRKLTEVAVEMTWAGSTEQAKDDMCAGVDMFGTDWAAKQLRDGGGTDSELDWDLAAELIADKCALR